MRLADWMENTGKSPGEVAAAIGAQSRTTVHRYRSGSQVPMSRMMVKLFLFTNGQVQPNDFYELPWDCLEAGARRSTAAEENPIPDPGRWGAWFARWFRLAARITGGPP